MNRYTNRPLNSVAVLLVLMMTGCSRMLEEKALTFKEMDKELTADWQPVCLGP